MVKKKYYKTIIATKTKFVQVGVEKKNEKKNQSQESDCQIRPVGIFLHK